MPTLGEDSHLILYHADISAGAGTGFLVVDDTAISAQRTAMEIITGTYTETTKLFASIVCADYLKLPNGARDTRTRAQVYAALLQYLQKRSGLTVATPVGTYTGMFCLSHLATESHFPSYSIIVCTFNSSGAAFAPASIVAYENSKWVDPATYTGDRNWGNSVWRT